MENNKKENPGKPWKEKKNSRKKKKMKLWVKIVLSVIAALVLIMGVLIGCAFSKDPDSMSHKNEEALI